MQMMEKCGIVNIMNILLSFGFTLLIWVSSLISIPIEPVPLTFQSAAVFLTALLLPMGYAVFSVGLYILLGILGLPVFANGNSGLETLMGPTGGFIGGFLLVTIFIAFFTRDVRHRALKIKRNVLYFQVLWHCILGTILLQLCGILWGKYTTGLSWDRIIDLWVQPFYINMVLKILITVVICVHVWKETAGRTRLVG